MIQELELTVHIHRLCYWELQEGNRNQEGKLPEQNFKYHKKIKALETSFSINIDNQYCYYT